MLLLFFVHAEKELILVSQETMFDTVWRHWDLEIPSLHLLVWSVWVDQNLVCLKLGLDYRCLSIFWEFSKYLTPEFYVLILLDLEKDWVVFFLCFDEIATQAKLDIFLGSLSLRVCLKIVVIQDVFKMQQMNLAVDAVLEDHPGCLHVLLIDMQANYSVVSHISQVEV